MWCAAPAARGGVDVLEDGVRAGRGQQAIVDAPGDVLAVAPPVREKDPVNDALSRLVTLRSLAILRGDCVPFRLWRQAYCPRTGFIRMGQREIAEGTTCGALRVHHAEISSGR